MPKKSILLTKFYDLFDSNHVCILIYSFSIISFLFFLTISIFNLKMLIKINRRKNRP